MSAPAKVEFFLGVASRYSYLAATQIAALERDTGCSVEWRPFYSRELYELRGRSPFGREAVSGQYDWAYRRQDAEAWAAFYGVPYVEPDDALKFEPDIPRRLARACAAAMRLGIGPAYTLAVMSKVFGGAELEAFSEDNLAAIAGEFGGNTDRLANLMAEEETENTLAATARDAFKRGAFGVPTFFVGDTMFWGNDRLVLLRHHLMTQG